MRITADQIITVKDFLNEHKDDHQTKLFPEITEEISKLIDERFEVRFVNMHDDRYIYIWNEVLYILVYRIAGEGEKPTGFLWNVNYNEWKNGKQITPTLDTVFDSMPVIDKLWKNQPALEKLITGIIPACNEFIELCELVSSANWSINRVEKFYEYFVPIDKEEIETEDCLKELYKIKIENWDKSLWKAYDGKNQTIKTYRECFNIFQECYEQILELQITNHA